MGNGIVANVSTTISAPKSKVWDALVNPTVIKKYMFGTDVVSDWREGSPIVWRGEWKGKPYEDKGTICHIERETRLEYTHFSPLAGQPDKPENYHTVTVGLSGTNGETRVSLSQDNNPTEDARKHSERNWNAMLAGLKKYLES